MTAGSGSSDALRSLRRSTYCPCLSSAPRPPPLTWFTLTSGIWKTGGKVESCTLFLLFRTIVRLMFWINSEPPGTPYTQVRGILRQRAGWFGREGGLSSGDDSGGVSREVLGKTGIHAGDFFGSPSRKKVSMGRECTSSILCTYERCSGGDSGFVLDSLHDGGVPGT